MLVLDDFHLIDARDVQDGMAFLLEHLPPQIHLVIASRADPALPLARLRARGELVEIATGADAASLVTTGESLVATYNWTFLLGQSLTPGLNARLLGTLMYRSGLVPRVLPMIGLIGAPFLITGVFATLLGLTEQTNPLVLLPALPIFVCELSLGSYLIVKGFKPSPMTAGSVAAGASPSYRDVVG